MSELQLQQQLDELIDRMSDHATLASNAGSLQEPSPLNGELTSLFAGVHLLASTEFLDDTSTDALMVRAREDVLSRVSDLSPSASVPRRRRAARVRGRRVTLRAIAIACALASFSTVALASTNTSIGHAIRRIGTAIATGTISDPRRAHPVARHRSLNPTTTTGPSASSVATSVPAPTIANAEPTPTAGRSGGGNHRSVNGAHHSHTETPGSNQGGSGGGHDSGGSGGGQGGDDSGSHGGSTPPSGSSGSGDSGSSSGDSGSGGSGTDGSDASSGDSSPGDSSSGGGSGGSVDTSLSGDGGDVSVDTSVAVDGTGD